MHVTAWHAVSALSPPFGLPSSGGDLSGGNSPAVPFLSPLLPHSHVRVPSLVASTAWQAQRQAGARRPGSPDYDEYVYILHATTWRLHREPGRKVRKKPATRIARAPLILLPDTGPCMRHAAVPVTEVSYFCGRRYSVYLRTAAAV